MFDLVTGACLGPTMTLGADLAVLPLLLVVVTSFCVVVSVTGSGGVGNGWKSSLDNAAPKDSVVLTRYRTPARWTSPPVSPSER